MWYVYILKSEINGSFQKGSTNDLDRRLKEHNNKEEIYTSKLAPWTLVWFAEKPTNTEAKSLERKLKNITSRNKLQRFIQKYSGPDAPVGGLDADFTQ